jgi:hypothetical protein
VKIPPPLVGALIGAGLGFATAALGFSVLALPIRTPAESSPPMHRFPITDSSATVVEAVRGWRIFQAGDCTVWRFVDSLGVHYLAEGRIAGTNAVACSVVR